MAIRYQEALTALLKCAKGGAILHSCGYYLMFSPNPTSGETTLSLEPKSGTETFDENAEWELEIYDNKQSLKEKQTKLKGKKRKIKTQGWKEGTYTARVKYNGEIITGKLVVKK